jgi:hypothetical protein
MRAMRDRVSNSRKRSLSLVVDDAISVPTSEWRVVGGKGLLQANVPDET